MRVNGTVLAFQTTKIHWILSFFRLFFVSDPKPPQNIILFSGQRIYQK